MSNTHQLNETQTLTRLQPGMIIRRSGELWRVVMVNDCRARVVPIDKQVKTFTPATGLNAGKKLVIESSGGGENISPNSEVEIVSFT